MKIWYTSDARWSVGVPFEACKKANAPLEEWRGRNLSPPTHLHFTHLTIKTWNNPSFILATGHVNMLCAAWVVLQTQKTRNSSSSKVTHPGGSSLVLPSLASGIFAIIPIKK